jgi:hypothetical protein
MEVNMDRNITLFRKPGALIPLTMACIALAMPFVYVALFGNVYHEDEGTAAHLFQLLMVVQVPFIAFFAIKWLPRTPKQALIVLALQGVLMAAALAAVVIMERMAR